MVPRRERLHGAEARMLETPRQNYVTVDPCPPWRQLRERHAHLKRDARLLGKDSHVADRPDHADRLVVERADRRGLAGEVMVEIVAPTSVRLVSVRKRPTALPALPERWFPTR